MAWRLMPATRATTAAERPRATSSRDRETRWLSPNPARVPPRSRPPSSCARARARGGRSGGAARRPRCARFGPAQALGPRGEELLAPLLEQAFRDVVLAAELDHRL